MPEPTHACGVEQTLFGVQCQLPFGHDEPHKHEDGNGVTTWEPNHVAALRRETETLRERVERQEDVIARASRLAEQERAGLTQQVLREGLR